MSKDDLKKESSGKNIERRDFLQSLSTVPVLGVFGYALAQEQKLKKAQKAKAEAVPEEAGDVQELNIALIGAGAQGQVLMNAMLKIPGLRFKAVCDIWEDYHLKRMTRLLTKYKHDVTGYVDYREMLDKEKDLDAVVIATPDFWHARHAIACLDAGLNVYCEKEMSNNLEDAKKMVLKSRETGKFLQIGHQRRSHPKYQHCYNNLIEDAGLLGRIVTANGQWNRGVQPDLVAPQKYHIPESKLKEYGFDNMHQFRNWRWYKGLGGGPIVDLGSHQIDIFSWFLQTNPKAVVASGGTDYYDKATHEWYDTVMAIYEYETEQGTSRCYYQTQTTNSSNGYFETFMGDQGTLVLSESANRGSVYRESSAPAWDEWVQKGFVSAPKEIQIQQDSAAVLDVRETTPPDEHKIPIVMNDPYHKPHLENFFNTVRGLDTLNCPGEIGYETAVAVLKVNEAIEAGKRLEIKPEEFHV